MLLIHSPDRARGRFSLEMSLDTNELQSSKKKKKKLKESSLVHGRWFCFQEMDTHLEQPHTGPARGGGGRGQIRHPLISPSRTSSNRSNGTLRSRWICGVLQVSSGKHEAGCEGQGRAAPGSAGGWVRNPGVGHAQNPPTKGEADGKPSPHGAR